VAIPVIISNNRERKEAWDKSLQPIENALPGVKPDVVTPE
jgi:hypothetical protein